jgi:tetratricopeptide (TPR) repeat protein
LPPVLPPSRRAVPVVLCALAAATGAVRSAREARAAGDRPFLYAPALRPPEDLQPYLKQVAPGGDGFPEEKEAEELGARLRELGDALRRDGGRASEAVSLLLDPKFEGGSLLPEKETTIVDRPSLQILRGAASSAAKPAPVFRQEWETLVAGFAAVQRADFRITSIEVDRGAGTARTEVRYDLVGPAKPSGRVQSSGRWRIAWRRDAEGVWRVTRWSAADQQRSRAGAPVFTEVTGPAFGGNDTFHRQLAVPLDAWSATLDSGIARDSNGHNGVSAGDADGDGLDDLYVSQPAGLPNRLFRARGDGTFEDATESAGLAVLDDTTESLFADVDNDGDEDLVLALSSGLALFRNDGRGRFTPDPGAFQLQDVLRGSPMSMAMADYDRDGFLDLYVCVYSFYYGAGEGKAGTPMPYHDAENGPPSLLFRNDGHGRFVDATREAGLEAGNDRYHFAAAWGDYDGDGWPDLVVANDFGRKNLYHNRGRQGGRVTFEEVTKAAGLEDYGAGMSASFLDYDNDGRLDVYFGNMWSDAGQRVTGKAAFMPEAPADVRASYRRHVRGNSLFRNLGGGRFEDVTLAARAERGGWAWSSDALDFDGDGWEDLYVTNGMLTRESGPEDLESYFWRQVVARSPLARMTGTPYDDAWRAINQLLVHRSIASHQRNVLLRNDGHGGFDDVAGATALDLDQDGRSFAVLDYDGDGDPDLAVMAARGSPQLRLFRNDYADRGSALAVRLTGAPSAAPAGSVMRSNRDAVGARVTVETDRLTRTKEVQAGSGFISQHSKELLFGLGPSERIVRLTVAWPSGRTQTFTDVPLDHRLRIEEGGEPRAEPFRAPVARPGGALAAEKAVAPLASWLYEPFPVSELSLADLRGEPRSVSDLKGRPAVVLLWATGAEGSKSALQALEKGTKALSAAGLGRTTIALDSPGDAAKVRAAAAGVTLPVLAAGDEGGLALAVLYRHLFMNRQALPLPTALLLDKDASVVKVYRERVDVAEIVRDAARIEAPPAERLARAVPFAGTLYSGPGRRNYLPYGQELLDQGLDNAAISAFERAAQGSPSASTLYRLGTLLVKAGRSAQARGAFEKALALQPDLAEASNDLGALLAEQGDLDAAIERFRAALAATPEYPDALNNLGYALLQTGQPEPARELYEKALLLQPDFAEALNNLGLIYGRAGELDRAEPLFRQALAKRPDYGEAASNLALVLVSRGQGGEAETLLTRFIEDHPEVETTYVTLAKIYLAGDRRREALGVLARLLALNPSHPVGLELARRAR